MGATICINAFSRRFSFAATARLQQPRQHHRQSARRRSHCARMAAASRISSASATALIGITRDGGSFFFAKNNIVLTAPQIAAAGKMIAEGDYRYSEFCGRLFRTHWPHAVRQHSDPGHHLCHLGPLVARRALKAMRAAGTVRSAALVDSAPVTGARRLSRRVHVLKKRPLVCLPE